MTTKAITVNALTQEQADEHCGEAVSGYTNGTWYAITVDGKDAGLVSVKLGRKRRYNGEERNVLHLNFVNLTLNRVVYQYDITAEMEASRTGRAWSWANSFPRRDSKELTQAASRTVADIIDALVEVHYTQENRHTYAIEVAKHEMEMAEAALLKAQMAHLKAQGAYQAALEAALEAAGRAYWQEAK